MPWMIRTCIQDHRTFHRLVVMSRWADSKKWPALHQQCFTPRCRRVPVAHWLQAPNDGVSSQWTLHIAIRSHPLIITLLNPHHYLSSVSPKKPTRHVQSQLIPPPLMVAWAQLNFLIDCHLLRGAGSTESLETSMIGEMAPGMMRKHHHLTESRHWPKTAN